MSLERFEIISKLNNTLNELLILVRNKEDGQLYTIKSVRVNENSKKEKDLFFNELRILVPLTHKNIISYKEAFYDKRTKSLNMVIEYVDGGDLSMKIRTAKQKNVFLKEIIIWGIFIQILEGINYLHKKFIIHRDLKTSNIFLTKKGIVKIGGLNIGKNIEDLGMALTQIGTPYFTSPEIWEQKPYDYKCDIWSIGCILYEMTTLNVPFLGLNIQELYKNILSAKYKPIPKIYSKNLNEIIDLMLTKDPLKRPSIDDLLNNKIILEKKKELNLKNDDNDESSYINKAVDKIIKDYHNNKNKLENSHIIYKKMEKNNIKNNINHKNNNSINNNEKRSSINSNLKAERKINSFIYTNSNYDKIKRNKIPNSETNKIIKIDNSDENNNNINNIKSNKAYFSKYNKSKSNIPYSELNKKTNYFVSNNSSDKIREEIGNKIISPESIIHLDLNNNKIKNNFIKKMKINRNNNDVIHDIGYNSPKGIKTKNNLIYKIHEKSSNINNEVLNKNIFRNDKNVNKSLNNNIQHNINMNKLNCYKKLTKNKINENRNANIKYNNRNEIIISKRNPKSLSNLIKYNININNNRENYISRINTRNLLSNSINHKKDKSNMNNFIQLKENNNQYINNFNKDIRNINNKRKNNLRIYTSPNEIRNINSFVGNNNKKIDISSLFLTKPKLRLMDYNCLSEKIIVLQIILIMLTTMIKISKI
jgi:NIMA (never in mitosis gene a)-related kinase